MFFKRSILGSLIKDGSSSLKDNIHEGSRPTTGIPSFKYGKKVLNNFSPSNFALSINPLLKYVLPQHKGLDDLFEEGKNGKYPAAFKTLIADLTFSGSK